MLNLLQVYRLHENHINDTEHSWLEDEQKIDYVSAHIQF
jgi:hypothetical protein